MAYGDVAVIREPLPDGATLLRRRHRCSLRARPAQMFRAACGGAGARFLAERGPTPTAGASLPCAARPIVDALAQA